MSLRSSKPVLCVESANDLFVVVHLTERHGIAWPKGSEPVEIKDLKCASGVIGAIKDEVKAATNKSVGFLIDIDTNSEKRWEQVVAELKSVGAKPPSAPVVGGYIEEIAEYKARVGVWLLPDNSLDHGELEHFLRSLVPSNDESFRFAETCTGEAKNHGARFKDGNRLKADLHCWLAWQEEPGQRFGMAIKMNYFESHSDVALAFVLWFKRLYSIA